MKGTAGRLLVLVFSVAITAAAITVALWLFRSWFYGETGWDWVDPGMLAVIVGISLALCVLRPVLKALPRKRTRFGDRPDEYDYPDARP